MYSAKDPVSERVKHSGDPREVAQIATPFESGGNVQIVEAMASKSAFGSPLVTNTFRGLIAEAIVSLALGQNWRWCSSDYQAWDFENDDGARLEVKQSAARQTWARTPGKPSSCRFDIKPRFGRFEGLEWVSDPGRQAHIYVFAHHFVDEDSADHRDPDQWDFYVIPTNLLPPLSASIGLTRLKQMATSNCHGELSAAVSDVLQNLTLDHMRIASLKIV